MSGDKADDDNRIAVDDHDDKYNVIYVFLLRLFHML